MAEKDTPAVETPEKEAPAASSADTVADALGIEEEAEEASPAETNFADMADDEELQDVDDEPLQAPVEEIPAETAEAAPEAKPVEPTQPEQKPAGEETPAAEAPAAEATPVAPAETQPAEVSPEPSAGAEPLTQEQMKEQVTNWRTNTREALATHHYALSDELVEELRDEPEKAIPKLLASVHTDTYLAVMNGLSQLLPAMVQSVNQGQASDVQAEQDFQAAWPQVELSKHRDLVGRLGQTYRQLNPAASRGQFIQEVGAQAMIALRLQPAADGSTPAAEMKPFVPASGGPSVPAAHVPQNKFAAMAEEEELDDID